MIWAFFDNLFGTILLISFFFFYLRPSHSSTENVRRHSTLSVIHDESTGPFCTDASTKRARPRLRSRRNRANWPSFNEPSPAPLWTTSWRRETKSPKCARLNANKPSGMNNFSNRNTFLLESFIQQIVVIEEPPRTLKKPRPPPRSQHQLPLPHRPKKPKAKLRCPRFPRHQRLARQRPAVWDKLVFFFQDQKKI